ncbi:MAG: hypothetical protein EI684_04095 [Candidatus Viridilinea halotolerans]|uniref:Spermidine synthase n=1 Tax=Candidatus Viridilinea halotolerans TaxID=2491704 RepID=A0A426U6W4_9CHLR|nr:MAG: hypothetical protein EI684_04095 [Candidatus Viridilinea halotolerans]
MQAITHHHLSKYLGLALVSGCVLALQITFTRIFSLMIWHHFTYLVIGVALLGGGAAGTFLAVRQWDEATLQHRVGWLAFSFSMIALLNLVAIRFVAIDPLRAAQLVQSIIGLIIYFSCLFATFFSGGLVIAAIFSRWSEQAHRLYFADMLGAGVATVGVLAILQIFSGPGTIALVAILASLAALLLGIEFPPKLRWAMPVIVVGQVALLVLLLVRPLALPVPESKELGWAQRAQASGPEFTRWDPVGRVDVMPEIVITDPMIVGAVSSAYDRENAPELPLRLVTIDGTSMTGMYAFDGTDADLERFRFLDHAVISAVYHLGMESPSTLKIGVGGGLDILLARLYSAGKITAIELNPSIVGLLTGPYADYTGHIADHPSTELIVAEGRSFMTRTNEKYDIIQGIGLDNLAALSGGAYVLAESYIYTVNSLEQSLSALSPNGVFSWTRDVNSPPREMLRLTGLAAEALRRMGVDEPGAHIAIVANESGRNATLLVSRAPFTAEQMAQLEAWAVSNNFEPLQHPLVRLDTTFADYIYAPDPRAFERDYTFHIFPVTDDNPFFYNYFKWSNLHFDDAYEGRLNRFPIGNLILLTMFSMAVITAATFIVVPLARYKRDGLRTPATLPVLVYFSLLGAGYIFVQIVLIQRFTLFIGYPIHAVTTTIASMLAFSALGSLLARSRLESANQLRVVLLVIAALIVVYILVLPPIFASLLRLSDPLRILVSVLLLAPLSLVMGMPFPTGLRRLGALAPGLVPWAWGMNGVFSVLGSVLVIIISMLSSFTFALGAGALCYASAAAVSTALWHMRSV